MCNNACPIRRRIFAELKPLTGRGCVSVPGICSFATLMHKPP
jgi:hypothetical protein